MASNNYLNPVINGDSMMMNGHLFSTTLGATGLVTVTVTNLGSAIDTLAGYEVWVYADPEGLARSESLLVDDGIHAVMALTMTDTVRTDLGGNASIRFHHRLRRGHDRRPRRVGAIRRTDRQLIHDSSAIINPGESAYINWFSNHWYRLALPARRRLQFQPHRATRPTMSSGARDSGPYIPRTTTTSGAPTSAKPPAAARLQ